MFQQLIKRQKFAQENTASNRLIETDSRAGTKYFGLMYF